MADVEQLRWYGMRVPQGAEAQGGPVDSQPTQAVAPQATPRPAKGFSFALTKHQADRVLKRRALELAKREGWALPLDDDEFLDRAEVDHGADGGVTVVLSI